MHNQCIGSFYRQKRQQHAHHPILRMSINGASTILSFASWVMYDLIGCRHPFIRYWQPLQAKTTAICSLPQPDNERQRSIDNFSCCIFGYQGIAQIFAFIMELMTALMGQNKIYQT